MPTRPALFEQPLCAHPSQDWAPPWRLVVRGHWTEQHALALQYELEHGPEGALVLPAPDIAGPADGLWQHTCGEAFVGAAQPGEAVPTAQDPYHEYNWSPSGQWAHYHFAAERQAQAETPTRSTAFAIQSQCRPGHWTMATEVPLHALPPSGAGWWLGLSVVLEHASGRCSHWALHHPAPTPDFHHPAARCLRLWPPSV